MITLGKDSPVYKIFHWRFHCRVPQMAMVDEKTQTDYGVYTSYNINSAEQWASVPVDTMITIDEMVEFFREGYAIELVDLADAQRIYDIVTAHFMMWTDYTRTVISKISAPLDDFKVMDQLLRKIYPIAYRGHCKNNKETVIDDGLGELFALGGITELDGPTMEHEFPLEELASHVERVEAFRNGIG